MEQYQFSAEKRATLESLPQPLAVYQLVDGQISALILSDGFCEMFGYADRAKAYEDMNSSVFSFMHPDDAARIANAIRRFINVGGAFDVIYRTRSRKGSMYQLVHASGRFTENSGEARLAYVWFSDEGLYSEDAVISVQGLTDSLSNALHEGSILKAIQYDHLTGLPSLTHFFQLAGLARETFLREGKVPVFLYLDLTGMKFYNRRHSFAEGDRLLQAVAELLIRSFGAEKCCRAGGDHFGVVTIGEGLEERLKTLFQDCRELNGGKSLPIHVGIYSGEIEDVPVSVAYDRAKLACDVLKRSYKSCWHYYDKGLRDAAELRQYILSNLDRAIEEKWIQAYYQPIVRAVNERVCDDEALARWIDPVRGFLSPAEFIPILEEAGLVYKLDLYMLDQILEKLTLQKQKGLYMVPQSLNLSRMDFDACDIVEEVRGRVDAAGIRRDMITIEITESTLGRDFNFMKKQVERFRELGFPVWMDDFGSGYSSLDVLQSIKFDLLKFDMSFMQKLDKGSGGKIILTELMKMATALGVDTICEGVETEEQVRFLQEIGCSKLQGYYYSKPLPISALIERYENGWNIGYENPAEAAYFESIGRVNLFDLAVIANEDTEGLHNFFNTVPMGIMEVTPDGVRFARSNQSYRDFLKRAFGFSISDRNVWFPSSEEGPAAVFLRHVRQCCENGGRALVDEQLRDGSTAHSFVKKIAANPVTGKVAIAVAVLSVSSADQGTTYARIARALAADYYNLYYVDLDSERFIEYSSPVGGEELAMERHGDRFFETVERDAMTRIYPEDRVPFLNRFTKENILRELDEQGVFTASYRLIDSGLPMYVNMKIMRMQPGGRHLIIGISTIDAQVRQETISEGKRREAAAYAGIMALSGDYLSLYSIEPETGYYTEYIATREYESLGFAKTGEDFFLQGTKDGKRTIYAEDLPRFLREFTKENVLRRIGEEGVFRLRYRLMIRGTARPVMLKIVSVSENGGARLIAGVRTWQERS